LRFRCSREKGAVVVFEELNPMSDITGVTGFFVDPELGTNEGRGELGN
jgi:hypothetical protein